VCPSTFTAPVCPPLPPTTPALPASLPPPVSLATLINLICQIAISFPSGGKIATLEKTILDLNHEVSTLKEKLAAAGASADMLVAKAQLQCAREQYQAVEDALEKGYQRAQRAFTEMKAFVFQPAV
jgi:hypothetical protein